METKKTERYMSPFCKMIIQLEDIKAETGIDTFNIEQDFFSEKDSTQPSQNQNTGIALDPPKIEPMIRKMNLRTSLMTY